MSQASLTTAQLNTLLNSWQAGNVGHAMDKRAIEIMDNLGKEIGYGWLKQLAGFLYDTQCHKDQKNAAALKKERFMAMEWKLPDDFEEVAAVRLEFFPDARS